MQALTAVVLGAFVLLSFLLTVEKVTHGDPMHAIQGKGAVNPDGTPIVPQPLVKDSN